MTFFHQQITIPAFNDDDRNVHGGHDGGHDDDHGDRGGGRGEAHNGDRDDHGGGHGGDHDDRDGGGRRDGGYGRTWLLSF
uniref:Uncharacterized protein n=1 Tax=Panagrellus redivivus TaxID=6233 RepID=A0A7E5A0Q9_PANRE